MWLKFSSMTAFWDDVGKAASSRDVGKAAAGVLMTSDRRLEDPWAEQNAVVTSRTSGLERAEMSPSG